LILISEPKTSAIVCRYWLSVMRRNATLIGLSSGDVCCETAAADAASVTLGLAERQESAGYTNGLALLNAEQAYQQSQINLIQAQANRYADTAALFQALGGGWWHRGDLAQNKHEE